MTRSAPEGVVASVHRSQTHSFSKSTQAHIRLVAGLGVEADAHSGATVKHRWRVARHAAEPNLRQVHLIHGELHDELNAAGFHVSAGDLGENITTRGIDLLGLSTGTRLYLGTEAVVEVTGLRSPCVQLDRHERGLLAALLSRDEHGAVVRKSGVMSIVIAGGIVRGGDVIRVEPPAGSQRPLGVV